MLKRYVEANGLFVGDVFSFEGELYQVLVYGIKIY